MINLFNSVNARGAASDGSKDDSMREETGGSALATPGSPGNLRASGRTLPESPCYNEH